MTVNLGMPATPAPVLAPRRPTRRINVGKVYAVVEETLARMGHLPADSLEQVLEADRRAREVAEALLA